MYNYLTIPNPFLILEYILILIDTSLTLECQWRSVLQKMDV